MNRVVIALIIFLIVIWSGFIVLELQISKFEKLMASPKGRIDLVLILPLIIGITLYVIDQIINKIMKK
ncbi:hypothetical protein [Aquimarina sp. 2201CG5-10]|uniref:hypothetical protein n=1 Tax=Aquimarina callyspongiae TaxID=3098150 RepID=UPI002AB411AB|nr:hypothetical protein [Aquimarina sp. 2201CG5-10]MDY8135546.1 hypothetical protein [Aquimarina sp. 2201CG5-10]